MLNLLPQEQKKILKKEYSSRRLAVWLGSVVCVLAISLVLLSPSYFLTKIKAGEVRIELENTKRALDAELPPQEIVTELVAAVSHAEALKPLRKPLSVYDLVKIFESKPATIRIFDIAFQEQVATQPTITVIGEALDRESLIAFGQALESRVEFATVDLPVSNFVEEKNINFSMTIMLK